MRLGEEPLSENSVSLPAEIPQLHQACAPALSDKHTGILLYSKSGLEQRPGKKELC
jgi:hypothetical protein